MRPVLRAAEGSVYVKDMIMAPKAKKKDTTFFDYLITKAPKITVLSDNPVSLADMKSDTFNFRYHLGPVYDIIRHEKTQMPLTISINGKWGTGKTTAMQWLYDALEKWKQSGESKGKVKTRNVWFYPWKYHNKEDVWKGLITEVVLNVTDFNNASPATVSKAVKLLSAFVGKSALDVISSIEFELPGFKVNGKVGKEIIDNFQAANHPEQPYLNEYEDAFKKLIKDALSRTNERMVIFIDDLDRCMPDIALQVLEALKLYLKIDKLIFVLGMDKSVVKEAVRAYYEERKIKDIDAGCYLDKMFQVELELSPSKKEMDIYLDEQLQTVEYEQNLEYKDEQGNKKFYRLFKSLISKYGGRNPREVKRLINSSLIRGAGAEKIEKEANNIGLDFEQGVQIFFIQKVLEQQWNRTELVGDGGNGDDFFTQWSKIVRENKESNDKFPLTVKVPSDFAKELREDMSLEERTRKRLDKTFLSFAHQAYHDLLQDTDFSGLFQLLDEEDLGQLMQIEYSTTIAGVSKQHDSDLLKTEDAVIIRNAIAKELEKEPQDLKEKDYDSVTELSLYGKKITDIKLLEQCKNLMTLHLSGTGINDISALKGLTNLTQLWLDDNQISNISPLNGLANLTHLWLSNNQISDISPLEKLMGLGLLSLYGNRISNISLLEKLTNLTELSMGGNKITDISPLDRLKKLTQLRLNNNQISDISPLKNLTKLFLLDLNNTKVNDLTPIKGLNKLTLIYASSTQIDNIHAIKKLTNLMRLGITNTKVDDLEPIKDLSNLEALFFSNTQVNNLEPVKGLKKLKVLSFKNTNVNDLEPLKELSNLETLKIQNTQINSLEPIKGLSNLKELLLEGCEKITAEQIDDLQKALPDCIIPAAAIKAALIGTEYRLFFNPKVPGLSKTKIMLFGKEGAILRGQNNNESSWRIRSGFLELLDSDGQVHSRFYYNPDKNRFDHTNDPDTGSIRKHSIRDQYMLPEK